MIDTNDDSDAFNKRMRKARVSRTFKRLDLFYRQMWRDASRETMDYQWAFAMQILVVTFCGLSFLMGCAVCIALEF